MVNILSGLFRNINHDKWYCIVILNLIWPDMRSHWPDNPLDLIRDHQDTGQYLPYHHQDAKGEVEEDQELYWLHRSQQTDEKITEKWLEIQIHQIEENNLYCLFCYPNYVQKFESWTKEHIFQTEAKINIQEFKMEEGWKFTAFHKFKQRICKRIKS